MVLARHNAGVELHIDSLSVGGARLFGEISLGVGDAVQLMFEVDGHPIELKGEVVRREQVDLTMDRVAVRFVDMSPTAKQRIRALVNERLDLESQDAWTLLPSQ